MRLQRKQLVFAFMVLLFPAYVFSAGGAHHGKGVPIDVLYQAINVALILFGLVYFLKKPIAEHFKKRHEEYLALRNQAQATLEQAQSQYRELENRFNKLASEESQSIFKAQEEASERAREMLNDSVALAEKIKNEAKNTVLREFEKAKRDLTRSLLEQAFNKARGQINSKLTAGDQQRLQGEFVKRLEVVK